MMTWYSMVKTTALMMTAARVDFGMNAQTGRRNSRAQITTTAGMEQQVIFINSFKCIFKCSLQLCNISTNIESQLKQTKPQWTYM